MLPFSVVQGPNLVGKSLEAFRRTYSMVPRVLETLSLK